MKIKTKLFGILLVAIAGFSMIACGGGGGNGITGPTGGSLEWKQPASTEFGSGIMSGTTLYAVAHGNGKFVAAGSSGRIGYSADAKTWKLASQNILIYSIYGIAYGDGKFVAVDGSDKFAYSTNGENWTESPNLNHISKLFFADGKFIGVGGSYSNSGKIYYSLDGISSWTEANGDLFSGSSNINGFAHGAGRFVAVGQGGKIAYSTTGESGWALVSDSTFGSSDIRAIAYGGGKFIAVGQDGKMASSPDGITWTALPNHYANTITTIAYGAGMFFIGRSGNAVNYLEYSTNGAEWTSTPSAWFSSANGIIYGGDRFVAVGNTSFIYYLIK